jgi:hypothetical protein
MCWQVTNALLRETNHEYTHIPMGALFELRLRAVMVVPVDPAC